MSTSIEALEAEMLKLPLPDRTRLLERLIASLDSDQEIEDAWMKEAKRRDDEVESGGVQAIPLDAVLSQLRAELR